MVVKEKMLEQEPSEIEMMLPFHAAGTLNVRDSRRVKRALVRDPALATQYAMIWEEYAETIYLNENLGAPSMHTMQKLFAAIDAEPARQPSTSLRFSFAARFAGVLARLSPRTLVWSTSLGALVLVLQAGVIGAMLVMNGQSSTLQTASLSVNEPITRSLGVETLPRALVRFVPDARVADVAVLLDNYQASIVGGAKDSMFRLQFGNRSMTKDEITGVMNRLQKEKVVSLVVTTP